MWRFHSQDPLPAHPATWNQCVCVCVCVCIWVWVCMCRCACGCVSVSIIIHNGVLTYRASASSSRGTVSGGTSLMSLASLNFVSV